jgi:hypothetical protein
MRSLGRLVGALTVAAIATAAIPATASATQLLPDLGMKKLSKVTLDTTTMPGHRLLRYTAVLVNVGAGPLELIGTRPDTSTPEMSVVQRIYDGQGGSTDVPVKTTMFYAGDGHNHWHTKDIESGTLARLDNGVVVGTLAKHGFCFSDNVQYKLTLPGAPQTPHYLGSGCDPGQPGALTADMGLSVGWGDGYKYTTNLQWIDITGLPNGKYKLTVGADPGDVFQESSYSNNTDSAVLKITRTAVTLISATPGA